MHAFGRALLWACILANGLVHAQPATVADEGARLTAELIRLQQDSVQESDARTRLEALQSRIAAVASYPVQRDLAKLRIRLAEDDGERERLRDGLIALAERNDLHSRCPTIPLRDAGEDTALTLPVGLRVTLRFGGRA